MEYIYSEEVDPKLYETNGLINQLKLRMHKDSLSEIKGALRAQKDWSKHVHLVKNYHGGLGDRFSFIRVTVPECLPDRLELISYANEYAFLYDDDMEELDLQDPSTNAHGILETFSHDALSSEVGPRVRPEKWIQAQILSEMLAIDPQRAVIAMKSWASFVQLAAETRQSNFKTLETYIPARVIDAGELIWSGTLTFGMGITIPTHEKDLCMELAKPGYAALGLANDLFSWEKERIAAEKLGQNYVFNAIWVTMQERGVDEAEAKRVCSDEIRKYMADYEQVVQNAKNNESISKDLRKYLEAVLLSCIGNIVWSIYCPRYRT
ncbi:isoprenoid synthase domain-containing protein [Xylaria sp. FL0064]|nr:isoprenoid synthase domain-containing protein [Xylaria sp. FL0064]